MSKRCIYCSSNIDAASVVDICKPCMYQVWGEKMSQAILDGMTSEQEKGNLELGAVGSTERKTKKDSEELEIQPNVYGM